MKILNSEGKLEDFSPTLPTTKKKIDFEFQELCLSLEKTYGKLVWTLPFKYSEIKIRDAAKIAKERGKETFPYLVGIIKKLK